MDKLYVFQYLTDGAGNYLTNADGSFMINATQEYPLDMSTAGIASNRGDLRAVNSFSILANDAGDDWTLIINQYNLVGRFPTQAAALGALAGCFIHAGATADGLEFIISDMIQNGTGQIDADGDNLMSQTFSAGEFIGTIRNFNKDTWAGTTNSMQQDLMVVGVATEPLLLADPLQTIRVPARYDTSYAFEVRTDKPLPNAILLASETIGPITANITAPNTLVIGQPATASAALTGYDTRIPIKYAWTWTQNPNGIATVVKQETTTSSTSSYTPTGVFNYRVEVELIYAFDDVSTGVSDSEITQFAAQPFEWLQGPQIQLAAQDQYAILPVADVDYIGTNANLQFNFEWMKDGNPFGTDNALQLLVDPGVYTADVTGQNTWASDVITTRNSITITESSDVAYIRLFTDLGRTNDVTDNPPANTSVYAYAYSDPAGTQLITGDVTFTAPATDPAGTPLIDGGLAPGFTSWAYMDYVAEGGSIPDTVAATGYDINNEPEVAYKPSARFVNPLIQDRNNATSFDVLVHPYQGLTRDMKLNSITRVDFYLNGGAAVSVTETTTNEEGLEVYRAVMPDGVTQDVSEVRAVVYPKVGIPRILQGHGFVMPGFDSGTNDNYYYYNEIPSKRLAVFNDGSNGNWRAQTLTENRGSFVGIFTDVYIGPAGDDGTGDGSSSSPYATAEVARDSVSGPVRIINGYSDAGMDEDHLSVRDTLQFTNAATSAAWNFYDRLVPQFKGGTILFTQSADWNTTPDVARQNAQNVVGAIYHDVDFRAGVNADGTFPSDFGPGNFVIRTGTANTAHGTLNIMQYNGCDFAMRSFAEIEEQSYLNREATATSPLGSAGANRSDFAGGLRLSFSDAGGAIYGQGAYCYNTQFRYVTPDVQSEVVNCVVICPPTQNDVTNAQLHVNTRVYDVDPYHFPWGPLAYAETSYVSKANAATYTGVAEVADEDINTPADVSNYDIVTQVEDFYTSIGYGKADPYQATPIEVTVTGPDQTAFDAIPSQGYWDAFTFAGAHFRNVGLQQFTDSAIVYARDPHFDILQQFDTQRSTGNNLIVHKAVVGGGAGRNWQGIFLSDGNISETAAIWDINMYRAVAGATCITFGSVGSDSTFNHLGPKLIGRGPGSISSTSFSANGAVTDFWMYDIQDELDFSLQGNYDNFKQSDYADAAVVLQNASGGTCHYYRDYNTSLSEVGEIEGLTNLAGTPGKSSVTSTPALTVGGRTGNVLANNIKSGLTEYVFDSRTSGQTKLQFGPGDLVPIETGTKGATDTNLAGLPTAYQSGGNFTVWNNDPNINFHMMNDAYLSMGSFNLYTDEGSGFVLRDTKAPNTGNFGTYLDAQYARVTFFNYQTAVEDTPIKVTYTANVDSARFAPGEGPAPVAPADWDTEPVTYFHSTAGTVGYIFNTAGWDGTGQTGADIPPETTTTSGGNARMGNTVSGGWDGDLVNTTWPHVYVWTLADGWSKVTQVTVGSNRPNIDFDSATVTYSGTPDTVFAFYTTDQGDPSGWRAYDGPTS